MDTWKAKLTFPTVAGDITRNCATKFTCLQQQLFCNAVSLQSCKATL